MELLEEVKKLPCTLHTLGFITGAQWFTSFEYFY